MNAAVNYICPACGSPTERKEKRYVCNGCTRGYPILHGIPDFRLKSDPYLSLEEERAKAARLADYSNDHDFAALVRYYYDITDDVPPHMVPQFSGYVLSGEVRGRELLRKLPPGSTGNLIDIGCGSGGFVAAAARHGHGVTGVDIALRWLVIAKKRLETEGLRAELVCADVTALPFPCDRFAGAVAADIFEHVPNSERAVAAISSVLLPGAGLVATAANRYTIGPYPLAGLIGVGYLPPALRSRYLRWRRGIDTLRHANLQSPRSMKQALRRAGFSSIRARALEISSARQLTRSAHRIRPFYEMARRAPGLREILVAIGPAVEITAVKPQERRENS